MLDSSRHADRFEALDAPKGAPLWSAQWTVPETLAYLDGHFPGMPVLPAAVILEVSLAMLRCGAGLDELAIRRARQCKFKGPVLPGETYFLRAETTDRRAWQVTWMPSAHGTPFVELGLVLEAPLP